MRIYPADLRESGIMVYTQADKERIETPSAANGWNLTTYRPDAKRARDITAIAGSVCLVICSFLLSGQDHFPSLLATLPARLPFTSASAR